MGTMWKRILVTTVAGATIASVSGIAFAATGPGPQGSTAATAVSVKDHSRHDASKDRSAKDGTSKDHSKDVRSRDHQSRDRHDR